jgi:hypothetical protein
MILATGVILLQLSGVMPGKAVAQLKPVVAPAARAANMTVSVSPEDSRDTSSHLPLSNVHLTDLNFASTSDAPDTSASVKAVQPAASLEANSITPIHVPQIKPPKHSGIESAEEYPRRSWLMLMVAQHGAAAFDAYSTRYAVGHGAVEQNPLMRPFVHSDSIYAVSQITPTILDFVSHRMMRSDNGFIRHMWWMPQTLSLGTYVFAGVHNLQVASH